MNQVSSLYKIRSLGANFVAPTKQWSLSEWINNFLRDDGLYYGDTDYDDNYLPENDPMPGGDADGMYEDIDDGILESLIIITLAAALVFLIYYRQQRQLAGHGRNDNQQAAGVQQGNQQAPQGQQEDRGVFPQPGDPEFGQWVAGGVGH